MSGKVKKIKKNTLVKFDYKNLPEEEFEYFKTLFPPNEVYIFLGEIRQMPGHCILLEFRTGKMLSGYHTENFIPLKENEV